MRKDRIPRVGIRASRIEAATTWSTASQCQNLLRLRFFITVMCRTLNVGSAVRRSDAEILHKLLGYPNFSGRDGRGWSAAAVDKAFGRPRIAGAHFVREWQIARRDCSSARCEPKHRPALPACGRPQARCKEPRPRSRDCHSIGVNQRKAKQLTARQATRA